MSKTATYFSGSGNELEYDVLVEHPDGTVDLGTAAVDPKTQPVLVVGKCPVSATAQVGFCVLGYERKEPKPDPKRPVVPVSTEAMFARRTAEANPQPPTLVPAPAVVVSPAPAHESPAHARSHGRHVSGAQEP